MWSGCARGGCASGTGTGAASDPGYVDRGLAFAGRSGGARCTTAASSGRAGVSGVIDGASYLNGLAKVLGENRDVGARRHIEFVGHASLVGDGEIGVGATEAAFNYSAVCCRGLCAAARSC